MALSGAGNAVKPRPRRAGAPVHAFHVNRRSVNPTPDPAAWIWSLDRLAAGEFEGVTAQPLTLGDPYYHRGQIPLIISEWGGFGFSNYGGPGEENADARANRIKEFKREMRRRPIAGDVYTQATSIEEENNGIIDPKSGELLLPPGILDSGSLI